MIAGRGIPQRGPFFSEVLAVNVKMGETSEGKENCSFCSPSGAIMMGSLCHTLVAKGSAGQTSVAAGAGKL